MSSEANPPPQAKRRHPRVIKLIRVEHLSGDTYLYDYSYDVSESGIFILTDTPLPTGSVIELKLGFPESDRTMQIKGEVIWVKRKEDLKPVDGEEDMGRLFDSLSKQADPVARHMKPQGMGIRFIDMTDEQKKFIQELLQTP